MDKQAERAWINRELEGLYRELDQATSRAMFADMHRLIDEIDAMEKVRDSIKECGNRVWSSRAD